MSAKLGSGFLLLRILISILLLVAGVLAMRAVDSIAATEVMIDNAARNGDGDNTLPRGAMFLIKWQDPLRALTMLVCSGGLVGVWLLRQKGWLTVGLMAAVLLLLESSAIRFILDQVFATYPLTPFHPSTPFLWG